MADRERLEHSLTNHPPADDAVIGKFDQVRTIAKAFGVVVLEVCPASRERSLAITKLEESVMWAVKAIACNQGEDAMAHEGSP